MQKDTVSHVCEGLEKGLKYEFNSGRKDHVIFFSRGIGSVLSRFIEESYYNTDVMVLEETDGRMPGWLDETWAAVVICAGGRPSPVDCDKLRSTGAEVFSLSDEPERFGGKGVKISHDYSVGEVVGAAAVLMKGFGHPQLYDGLTRLMGPLRSYCLDIAENQDVASMAKDLKGRIPAMYTTSETYSTARYWECMFLKKCGIKGYSATFPEFNHNQIMGWADETARDSECKLIILRVESDDLKIDDLVDCTIQVLTENRIPLTVVSFMNKDMLLNRMEALAFGDTLLAYLEGGAR
ncbi:MAG: hypothetical protein IJ856_02955 [Candidatus Methanomethylophilaceae archaeon]|nr:hypothetical protein [Candidatus Methanomethylophilaceae archaeon]